jgi:hypothetical protein
MTKGGFRLEILIIVSIFAAFWSGFYFAHKRDNKPMPLVEPFILPHVPVIGKERKERLDVDEEKKNEFFS